MKSTFEDETYEDRPNGADSPKSVRCTASASELVSPEEVSVGKVEIYQAERWSDLTIPDGDEATMSTPDDVDSVTPPPDDAASEKSPPEDLESARSPPGETEPDSAVANEPSEMYYTASSEVSLLSDMELPERVREDDAEERRECAMAGHVAAMRERFESMTRTNTPCPELARSMSPSLEVFRNITPSPDRLG